MFVQSHIQRNRHPLGTTSATPAASASSHQHHNRQAPAHHHNHSQHNSHQQHQRVDVEGLRTTRSQEIGKRENHLDKPKTSRWTAGTSAFGEKSNQCNSFFNQCINQEDVNRAPEAPDRGKELIVPITNARDDADLLDRVEVVKSKLVSRLAANQAAFDHVDLSSSSAIAFECRGRRYVKSTSLIDLKSQPLGEKATSPRARLLKRSRTINSIVHESAQSGSRLTVASNEKWTQINGSLDHIGSSKERETKTDPVSINSSSLVSGVFDLPRTLWNLCIVRATAPTNDHEKGSEGRLNLRKNLKAVAWFWANFLTFQYETLKQIYLIVRTSGSRLHHSQSEMAASRSEYLATALQRNGTNHRYADGDSDLYSNRARYIKYTNPSIALVGSIEPRLVHYEKEAWPCDRQNYEHDSHGCNHNHHHQPNHVHVHNHVGLADYYGAHIEPLSLDCTCSYHRTTPKSSSSMHRPQQRLHPKLSSQAVNVRTHNRVSHRNVIAIGQQQQALANSSEARWQWHLRHTVDGSPYRTPDHHVVYDDTHAPTSLSYGSDHQNASFCESHRASISSPTLLESSQRLDTWRIRQLPELRSGMGGTGLQKAKTERLADCRLGDPSDELSVISDHEPPDKTSFQLSATDQRMDTCHQQLPTNRPPQALVPRRGQYGMWSSMDSEKSTRRYNGGQAQLHHASSSTNHGARNWLMAQSSLTTGNTSSISGLSVSSAASLHNQHGGKTDNTRGGASGVANSSEQKRQQQQTSRRRANPLSKVSLAGAKRRLGFKRRDINSLSVHRSEEVFPGDVIGVCPVANQQSGAERRLRYAYTTGSSSLNDSSFESAQTFGALQSPWYNQFRSSPDPKVCFVDGLGAGQIASRQALVSPYLGDIQLGLSDRRGMLEVEVIRVRQLQVKSAAKRLPSPYVKVYLMRDKKCLAKFKTRQVRETLDPLYQQQFIFREDYSNCVLQVIVWGDYSKKDKKSLMGAVQIYINDLDMSNLVIGWYKLFNAASMMNSSLASSSKAIRQTMSSSRLATDFFPLTGW